MSDLDLDAIKARVDALVSDVVAWHTIPVSEPFRAFLIAARQDIPALIAEVERLREVLRAITDGDHDGAPTTASDVLRHARLLASAALHGDNHH